MDFNIGVLAAAILFVSHWRETRQLPPETARRESRIERARKQAEAAFWKPVKEGDFIDGQVIKITEGGKFDSTFFHVKAEDGKIEIVAASKSTNLGKMLAEHPIDVLGYLCVLYLGEKPPKNGGNPLKIWSVVYDPPEVGKTPPADDETPF